MSTVSNRNKNKGSIFDENNDISFDKNKTLLNSISCGVYHRKKLKIRIINIKIQMLINMLNLD